jgi:hypothetical protein
MNELTAQITLGLISIAPFIISLVATVSAHDQGEKPGPIARRAFLVACILIAPILVRLICTAVFG